MHLTFVFKISETIFSCGECISCGLIWNILDILSKIFCVVLITGHSIHRLWEHRSTFRTIQISMIWAVETPKILHPGNLFDLGGATGLESCSSTLQWTTHWNYEYTKMLRTGDFKIREGMHILKAFWQFLFSGLSLSVLKYGRYLACECQHICLP